MSSKMIEDPCNTHVRPGKFPMAFRPTILSTSRIVCLSVIASASVALADVTYENPVIPGDHPDPSIIRVGNDFWATTTSSEWGPQFPILHSTDLVNWEQVGSVFPHRPEWATANFWAPEISEFNGKFFVYYVGRAKGGALSVAVATATQPAGPYTDHGPLVSQPDGSIDPVPVADEHGDRYLIWKEDGNSRRLPSILWIQKLDSDGTKLIGEPKELFRNTEPWEGAVIEGPFVVRRGEWFYLFYSGNGCCGKGCDYALGVARSHSLLGPWEKNPANPILAGNTTWKCPGHGSIVQDGKNRYWLLYHAYSAKDFIYTGREALLDEVAFNDNGWPTINNNHGPGTKSSSPFNKAQRPMTGFVDSFSRKELQPGWEWPQQTEPEYHFNSRGLELGATSSDTNFMAAVIARATRSGDYKATTQIDLSALKPGAAAGIAAIGDPANAVGLAVQTDTIVLWRCDKGKDRSIASAAAPKSSKIHLRLWTTNGETFRFESSADGKKWTAIGGTEHGDNLPPWDRSLRVGLTVGGTEGAKARFNSFEMVPAHP